MTLTEIIDEHDWREVLIAGLLPGSAKADECRARDAFARRHLARLVAVAKAAVEAERKSTVARAVYGAIPDESRQGEWQREAWRAAREADDAIEKLFAAVRGEEEKKG